MQIFRKNGSYLIVLFFILFFSHCESPTITIEKPYINIIELGFSENASPEQNSTAIMEAFELAHEKNKPVRIPTGAYTINNIDFPYDYLSIEGDSMPMMIDGVPSGGTILLGGRIGFNNRYAPSLKNIAIDVSDNYPFLDAVHSGFSKDGSQKAHIENVLLLGSGEAHGILLTAGGDNYIKNVFIYDFSHGVALRSSRNELDSFFIQDCQVSSVITKAIASDGVSLCYGNIVKNGMCRASALGKGGGIFMNSLSEGSKCFNNTFSNIRMEKVNYAIRLNGNSDIYNNLVRDINIERPNQAGLYIDGPYSDYNTFLNILVNNANGHSFANMGPGKNNDILQSQSFIPKYNHYIGEFRILEIN